MVGGMGWWDFGGQWHGQGGRRGSSEYGAGTGRAGLRRACRSVHSTLQNGSDGGPTVPWPAKRPGSGGQAATRPAPHLAGSHRSLGRLEKFARNAFAISGSIGTRRAEMRQQFDVTMPSPAGLETSDQRLESCFTRVAITSTAPATKPYIARPMNVRSSAKRTSARASRSASPGLRLTRCAGS